LAGTILNIAFQSAPRANARDRGRLEDEDKSILEAGQLPAKVGDNPRSRETPASPFLERLQGKENRAGVWCVRECRTVETDKRGRVQRSGVLENFPDTAENTPTGPMEGGAGRKIKHRKKIPSIERGDWAGGGVLSCRYANAISPP